VDAHPASTTQQLERVPLTDVSEVHLHMIDDGQWRVLDRRLPDHDVAALLGFVERVGPRYEATLIGRPLERHACDDLLAVCACFVEGP
jgi:hypothetical protein